MVWPALPSPGMVHQQFSFWRLTGIDLRFEFKAPDHEMHQVLPTVKDHITHQGLDIMEKRLAPSQHTTQQRVVIIAPLEHRVEQEGEQIQAEHERRQILLPMPKVMLH